MSYAKDRFEFLAKHEGVRYTAYDDATGKPMTPGKRAAGYVTIGVGFNMDELQNRHLFEKANQESGSTYRWEEVYNGVRAISDTMVYALFNLTITAAENIVKKRVTQNLTDKQHIALCSMAFNGPVLLGPKLCGAINTGDFETARNEVLWNSNRKRIPGLAKRRWHEADYLVAGTGVLFPTLDDYMKAFAAKA